MAGNLDQIPVLVEQTSDLVLEDTGPGGNETLKYPWMRHDAADLFGALDPAMCREFKSLLVVGRKERQQFARGGLRTAIESVTGMARLFLKATEEIAGRE